MPCINAVLAKLTMTSMHDSVMRLLACAKIASRNTKNPIADTGRLAEMLNVSSATMTNWKKRGVSKDGALLAEKALGSRPTFVLEGKGDPFSDMPALPQGMSALAALGYPEVWDADMRGPKVAHDMSQARNSESSLRIPWEDLMTADLSRPFELDVVDNALGDDIVIGCVARFHPAGARAPTPGRPVLVRDREGNHYLRDYEQGPGKRWRAVARKSGFLPMDSEELGLVVVAVLRGVDYP